MTTTVVTPMARAAAVICLLIHLLFGVLMALSVFPPDIFLVRGEPATTQPGLEYMLPKLVAIVYASLSSGLALALYTNKGGEAAVRSALVSVIVYHLGCISVYVFGNGVEALNKEKTSALQIIVLHIFLQFPAVLSFLLLSSSQVREKKD